jgi:hypothetical protein
MVNKGTLQAIGSSTPHEATLAHGNENRDNDFLSHRQQRIDGHWVK